MLTILNRLLNAIIVGGAFFLFSFLDSSMSIFIPIGFFGTFFGLFMIRNDKLDIGITVLTSLFILYIISGGKEIFEIGILVLAFLWSTAFPFLERVFKSFDNK